MVKRYDLWLYYNSWEKEESDDGYWVKYEDHAAELAALRAENERLREALKSIANGDGIYGAQAWEYKRIAREALK